MITKFMPLDKYLHTYVLYTTANSKFEVLVHGFLDFRKDFTEPFFPNHFPSVIYTPCISHHCSCVFFTDSGRLA